MGKRPYVAQGYKIAEIKAEASSARQLKSAMSVAYIVRPKFPFFARATRHSPATIHNATDVNETIEVIIADITCALILDGKDNVLAAIQTN